MTKRKPLAEPLPGWGDNWDEEIDHTAKVGMRVQVVSGMGRRNRGLGTVTKVEPLDIEWPDGSIDRVSDNYPLEITLDNGKHTEGARCWWYPIASSSTSNNVETPAKGDE